MKRALYVVLLLALGGCFATVGPGGRRGFSISLPSLLPPLVVVQPGVSVVRDFDDEVFFTDGYYYARQDDYWYRTRDHHGSWEEVETQRVPVVIVKSPRGQYRQYRGDDHR
jgi:hypothetical protein